MLEIDISPDKVDAWKGSAMKSPLWLGVAWLPLFSNFGIKLSSKQKIVHFTVVCLVAKPLNRNEAKGDLVMIQTLLLFKGKLFCFHAN